MIRRNMAPEPQGIVLDRRQGWIAGVPSVLILLSLGLLLLLDGCSESSSRRERRRTERACELGDFVYQDWACGLPSADGVWTCSIVGDGRCYVMCESDSECSDSGAPYCRRIGLFFGGDYGCNQAISVCRDVDVHDCPKESARRLVVDGPLF